MAMSFVPYFFGYVFGRFSAWKAQTAEVEVQKHPKAKAKSQS
jgi:hypothetical protein